MYVRIDDAFIVYELSKTKNFIFISCTHTRLIYLMTHCPSTYVMLFGWHTLHQTKPNLLYNNITISISIKVNCGLSLYISYKLFFYYF